MDMLVFFSNKVFTKNTPFMKVHSGMLKDFTENDEGISKSLVRGKLLSKSIDYNIDEALKSRPMSCDKYRVKK